MEQSLSRPQSLGQTPSNWFRQLPAIFRRWQLNARTRRQLAQLDERLLADAGISANERLVELDKPFWR